MKFPEVNKPETLEKKYLGKLSKKALSFMKSLLRMDPTQRMSADEVLIHPYFEGLREKDAPPPLALKEKEFTNTMRLTSRHDDPNDKTSHGYQGKEFNVR